MFYFNLGYITISFGSHISISEQVPLLIVMVNWVNVTDLFDIAGSFSLARVPVLSTVSPGEEYRQNSAFLFSIKVRYRRLLTTLLFNIRQKFLRDAMDRVLLTPLNNN